MSSVLTATGARVIVALDFPNASEALAFTACVTPEQCRLKVGFELFTSAGPAFVETLVQKGFDVFLDLKYHDIPNTVANACAAAARLGVWMLNVHTLGGRDMLRAARAAIDTGARRPLLIGVTLLTSHSAQDLAAIGLAPDPTAQVARLAGLAKEAGLDGVVCSAQEAAALRRAHGPNFCLVTPGIRPEGTTAGDQRRVMTPAAALRAGAHYLVIGRPITRTADPRAVLAAINQELLAV
jgi:orotidine-5'-phosphate decarboxylase